MPLTVVGQLQRGAYRFIYSVGVMPKAFEKHFEK